MARQAGIPSTWRICQRAAPRQHLRRTVLGRDVILFVAAGPDEPAGYDPLHYRGCVRLRFVDPPPGPCDCDECAKELARRCPRQN